MAHADTEKVIRAFSQKYGKYTTRMLDAMGNEIAEAREVLKQIERSSNLAQARELAQAYATVNGS